jgi:hypothetical protein
VAVQSDEDKGQIKCTTSLIAGAISFAILGASRGSAVGDAAGMTIHAIFKLLIPMASSIETPRDTFLPGSVAVLLAFLAAASLVSAALELP